MSLCLIHNCRFDFVLAATLLGAMVGGLVSGKAMGEEAKPAEASLPSEENAPPVPLANGPVELEPQAPSPSPAPPAETLPSPAPSSLPVPSDSVTPPEPPNGPSPSDENVALEFNFRYQPWEDVLNWFARRAGFSLVMNAPPPGTFNYTDDHSYTPAEAIDLLNGVLLTKGYTLILRDRMLMLINLEDGIPPNLVSTVTVEELESRGKFELVSTLFQLENLRPEEAESEIKRLLGPQGSAVVLPKSQQLLVTETAGRLRTIGEVIRRADNPAVAGPEQVQRFAIASGSPEEVLGILRQMFNIPAGQNATSDGTIRLAWDSINLQLLVAAPPAKMEQIGKILKALPSIVSPTGSAQTAPQLEVYEVYPSDPDATLKVLQTLLVGAPGARLTTDPKTGNLVALARPSEHATIRATLEQMQREALRVEVLRLRFSDPQTAAQSIQNLFAGDAKAPTVQADAATRQLLVRGSEAQLRQIRTLLQKMGETELVSEDPSDGGKVRMIPITGPAARSALERLGEIWPTMRRNQIRTVTPSAVIPTLRPSQPPADIPPPSPPPARSQTPAEPSAQPQTTAASSWTPVVFVSDVPNPKAEVPAVSPPSAKPTPPIQEPSPIVVAPGPGGVVIASEDLEALDEFESMLKILMGSTSSAGANMTIFYLKYAKANSVAETLDRVLGGGTLPQEYYDSQRQQQQQQQPPQLGMPFGRSAFPGGRGMPGEADMQGRPGMSGGPGMPGGLDMSGGPGMPGSSMFRGSGMSWGFSRSSSSRSTSTTPAQNPTLRITPDTRLNALIVRANPIDLELIEELLRILDQVESPEEVLAQSRPRLIPVHNTQADEIVSILKEVYSDRIGASSSSRNSRGSTGMSPFMMMFRGPQTAQRGAGGRTSSSSSSQSAEEPQTMSLGVDSRTNSVIVSAPEPLFAEVKQLIEQLDIAAVTSNQTMRVVTLRKASLTAVEEALSSLMGDSVQVTRTTSSSSSTTTPQQPGMRQSGIRQSDVRQRSTGAQSRTSSQRSETSRQTMPRQMSGPSTDGAGPSRSFGPPQ